MFGQKSAFGTTSGGNTSFGAAGGSSLFGAQNKPTGVTFGQPQQQPVAGTGLFGSAGATSSLFGTPANAAQTSIFNKGTSAFGQQQPAAGTSLFGSSGAQQQSALFGGGAPAATSFGGTSLFGASSTTASTGGGLFGGQTTTTTGGGLFGATLGASAMSGTVIKFDPLLANDTMMKGSSQQSIQTKHQCITAMKQYETKSLEELRVEDYLANRKGPQASGAFQAGVQQAAPQQTGGLFGGTSGGLFGGAAAVSQQAKPSLFGNTGSAFSTATSTTGGLFGAPAAQSSSLFAGQQKTGVFGAPATTAVNTGFAFGQTPASTAGGGLFGKPATQSAFGQPQPQGSLFGQTATTATQPFGQTAGTFGQTPAGGGLFAGAQNKSLFGATSTAGGLFGQPAAPSNAFGQQSLLAPKISTAGSAFGGAGLFGTPATSTAQVGGGLFGAAQAPRPGGFFGAPQQPTGGGLFGSTAVSQPGSLFGPTAQKSMAPAAPFSFSSNVQPGGSIGGLAGGTGQITQPIALGTDPTAALMQQALFQSQVAGLSTSPYGGQVLLRLSLRNSDTDSRPNPTDPLTHRRLLQTARTTQQHTIGSGGSLSRSGGSSGYGGSSGFSSCINTKPSTAISRNIPLLMSPLNRSGLAVNRSGNSSLFTELDDDTALLKEGFVLKKNVKRLILPTTTTTRTHGTSNTGTLQDGGQVLSSPRTTILASASNGPQQRSSTSWLGGSTPQANESIPELNLDQSESGVTATNDSSLRDRSHVAANSGIVAPVAHRPSANKSAVRSPSVGSPSSGRFDADVEESKPDISTVSVVDSSVDFTPSAIASPDRSSLGDRAARHPVHPASILLTKSDYFTVPSMGELADMTGPAGDCFVTDGFTVGRRGYGSVFWCGEMNVANLDIDQLVTFRHKEVVVYPDEENKPPVGEELNRKAEITLERVWPNDKATRLPIKDANRLEALKYRDRLEKASAQMGATFKDYRPDTGAWVFEVPHFSKYGLTENDEDEDMPSVEEVKQSALDQSVQSGVQRQKIQHSPPIKTSKMERSTVDKLSAAEQLLKSKGLGGSAKLLESYYDDSASIQDELPPFNNNTEQFYSEFCSPSELSTSHFSSKRSLKLFQELNGDVERYESEPKAKLTESLLSDVFQRANQLHTEIETSAVVEDKDALARSFAGTCEPPTLRLPTSAPHLVPYTQSLTWQRAKSLRDVSSFNARSYRVGWNHHSRLFYATATNDQGSTVECKQLLLGESTEAAIISKMIDITLSNSQLESIGGNCCPKFNPVANASYVKDVVTFSSTDNFPWRELEVWSLVDALWGDLDVDFNSYLLERKRAEQLSSWLTESTADRLTEELRGAALTPSKRVLRLLVSGRVMDAARAAVTGGLLRMAVLVAQAGSACPETKALLLEQLAQWRMSDSDGFIDADCMRIYALLAGQIRWTVGHAHQYSCIDSLDWKRALGLHLWYCSEPTEGIVGAVQSYDADWKSDQLDCQPPFALSFVDEQRPSAESKYDVCYHLLKLYCDRSHSLEALLNPAAFTDDLQNYHLSWHLWSVLSSLGYNHLSPAKLDALHTRYAEQLVIAGLWKEAIFILMHHTDDERRISAVKEMLCRCANLIEPASVEYLVERLGLPGEWVWEAKCLQANHDGRLIDEAWLAGDAQSFNLAHRLFFSNVAPRAVVDEDYGTLQRFIDKLSVQADRLVGWATGGLIYVDYLFVLELQHQAQLSTSTDNDAPPFVVGVDVKRRLLSFASRLSGMVCKTPLQRMCQGEMSRVAAWLLRAVLTREERQEVAPLLLDMPMSGNYALEEVLSIGRLCLHLALQ